MKNNELSKKEQLVFDYLVKSINENGYAPSVRDIVASLGIKSTSSVHLYLHNLEEKGFIKRIPDKRTKRIEITEKGAKTARKVMDYDEMWDEKLKEIIGNEEYDNFKNTLKKISEELI